jgi:hypothetical protein
MRSVGIDSGSYNAEIETECFLRARAGDLSVIYFEEWCEFRRGGPREDLAAAPGRRLQDDAVQFLLARYRLKPDETVENYYGNRYAGIQLSANEGIVQAIFLHTDGH